MPIAKSPEALFRELVRPPNGPPHLWVHQADLLRSYHRDHLRTSDVALELPTGAGKTLPGLLIAEWRRQAFSERVAYLCPTRQLARQVAEQATRYGIEVVVLVGSAQTWGEADRMRFVRGERVAITTYSAVFNSNPQIADAQTLVLDDAHAAEGFVAGAWTVQIDRDGGAAYEEVLSALANDLDDALLGRLRGPRPELGEAGDVQLVPVRAVHDRAAELHTVLATRLSGSAAFSFSMIRQQLGRCLIYLSWSSILIRPLIPPTFMHPAFDHANQRIYMSATMGEGGELERAFGRTSITRLLVPEGWDQHGTGRRFFLLPELADASSEDVGTFVRTAIAEASKALVLCPDRRSLRAVVERLVPDGMPVVGKDDIEDSLQPFIGLDRGVLALANRYDGLDLPDTACRLIVIVGLPAGASLQERFLLTHLGAGGVLRERLRTRLIQGAGRCTRNANDFASVILLGKRVVEFCGRRDVQAATHPEIQAELEFGIDNSMQPLDDLRTNLEAFLTQEQDDTWREQAEPDIDARRRVTTRHPAPGAVELSRAAPLEVQAQQALWRGEWGRAVQLARDTMSALTGGAELRPYQALWAYLGAAWASIAADVERDEAYRQVADDLLRRAHAAGRSTAWLRRIAPLPATFGGSRGPDELEAAALDGLALQFDRVAGGTTLERIGSELRAALLGTEAPAYEQALSKLGTLVGADAAKPPGDAQPDSAWIFGDALWICWEAKSEEASEHQLSVETVRQAASHLRAVAGQRGASIPPGSLTVIASPRQQVATAAQALAPEELRLLHPEEIVKVAEDVLAAWHAVRALGLGLADQTLRSRLLEQFRSSRCIGTPLVERLSYRPLSSQDSAG